MLIRQGLVNGARRWHDLTMRKLGLAVVLGLAWIGAARAETVLSLSATGSAVGTPDEMQASLNVEESGATPPAAQDAVNRLMAKALDAARKVDGVIATTAGYNVFQTQNQGYQASQALNLIMAAPGGVPPAAFTKLIGQLQQDGLQLNSLDGQLSAAGTDAAAQAATTDALRRLRSQANAIAATLGDKAGEIKTVTIDANNPGPVMPGRMMAMATMAPPQSAPGPVTVQVTAEATIVLTPLAP
jgi:predicted secreted protein